MGSHEIAMDDPRRVHILKPALSERVRMVCKMDIEKIGVPRSGIESTE